VLFRYVIDDDINTATAAELKIVLFGLFDKERAGTQKAQEAQRLFSCASCAFCVLALLGELGDTRWPPDTRGLPPGVV
jgi:hypothetical protein